jgi:hypothetical protein
MRTKILVLTLVTALVALVVAALATASKPTGTTFKLKAAMNIGQETARVKSAKAGAAGRFSATLDGTTLKWTLTFKNLSGPATMAHIHKAPRGVAGPIIVPLCMPCTSPVTGTTVLTADQVKDLLAGRDYANVHTAKNPGGEIRGQITKAPTS